MITTAEAKRLRAAISAALKTTAMAELAGSLPPAEAAHARKKKGHACKRLSAIIHSLTEDAPKNGEPSV